MRTFVRALEWAGGVVASASVAGLVPGGPWLLELASHFRVQYLVVLVVSAFVLLAWRRPGRAALAGGFAALNLWIVSPLWLGPADATVRDAGFESLLLNVNARNRSYGAVRNLVRDENPDLVVVQEFNARWKEGLADIAASYPHRIEVPRRDNYGLAVYSRLPLLSHRLLSFGNQGEPALLARLEHAGQPFEVLVLHAPPPVSPKSAGRRNAQLRRAAALVRGLDDPVVLLGDLNASPWSPNFVELLRESGLRDSQRGRGYQPTWPSAGAWLGIPIDHCLHSDGIVVLDRRTGPRVGSDHLPLIVRLAFAAGISRAERSPSTP